MIEHVHPEGEPTPTIREMYEMKEGLAEVVQRNKDGDPTVFRLTDKGNAHLGEIMRRNAAASIARGSADQEAVDAVRRAAKERRGKGNGKKGSRAKARWAGD